MIYYCMLLYNIIIIMGNKVSIIIIKNVQYNFYQIDRNNFNLKHNVSSESMIEDIKQ